MDLGGGVCWILCRGVCLDLWLLFFKFLIYIATMPGSDLLLPIEMLTLHLRTVVFVRGDAMFNVRVAFFFLFTVRWGAVEFFRGHHTSLLATGIFFCVYLHTADA
jgi:hypothetical protein